jgi:uncharacterized protein YjbJ (UPF0337 family)
VISTFTRALSQVPKFTNSIPRKVSQHVQEATELPIVIRLPKKTRPRAISRPNQNFMNSSTKDKVKGTAKEAVGKVKEETGKAIGNPDLRDRGTAEKVAGKVERKIGDVKKVFGK